MKEACVQKIAIRFVTAGLGSCLILAAILKVHWHKDSPPQIHFRLLEIAAVIYPASAFEICLGSLLLAGAWSPVVRWISIATFGIFACVSIAEALGHLKNCGCFGGGVHISPWIMAGFDSLCVIFLLKRKTEAGKVVNLLSIGKIRLGFALIIIATSILTAAMWALHRPQAIVAQSNSIKVDSDPFGSPGTVVLLEPDKLAGKPFLLSSHIDIGSQLSNGAWTVLLVHHDCDICSGAVPKYQALISKSKIVKLAVIEMPPYADTSDSIPGSKSVGLFGKLDTTRDWFATTPVVIILKDGIVENAADGEHAAIPDPEWLRIQSPSPQRALIR